MDPVSRDVIWSATLELVLTRPEFRVRDVENLVDEEVSKRTIRRTLGAMEDLGWLERESPGAHYWRPGPRARELLDLE